jgi:hypothetical protein
MPHLALGLGPITPRAEGAIGEMHMNPRRLLWAFTIAAGTTLLAACGNAPNEQVSGGLDDPSEPAAESQDAEEEIATQSAVTENEFDVIEEAQASSDLIELYSILDKVDLADGSLTLEQRSFIERRWEALLAESRGPYFMCSEADLVTASFKAPETQGNRYTLSMLFRLKSRFKKDRGLNMKGMVDSSHAQHLPELQKSAGFAQWGAEPTPPTTRWHEAAREVAGESYILINMGLVASPIPYRITVSFYTNEDGPSKFGPYGNVVDLGWHYDAPAE